MKSEEKIVAALQLLAQEDRTREASPEIEARLLDAFRQKRARGRQAWWAVAAAASVAVLFALWPAGDRGTPPAPVAAREVPPAPVAKATAPEPTPERKQPRQAARRPAPPQSYASFIPLVDAAAPLESGALLRVRVPSSTLRTVGLPVHEDRWDEPVEADVLIGQEGIVRAIRFVGIEK